MIKDVKKGQQIWTPRYIFFNVQMYHTRNGCMHIGLQNMICPPLYLHNLMGKWILCNLFQFHYIRDKETLLFSSSNPSDAIGICICSEFLVFLIDKLNCTGDSNQIEAMIKQSIDFRIKVLHAHHIKQC